MVFTAGAVFLMFYALMRFHERANRLQKRAQGSYGDRTGAYIAVGVIFGAIGLTFVLKIAF
jgi:arginine exporter protein ArgO